MNKIVSIIIPCYNVESFLQDCLKSVIHQTYKEIEILCINDCSSDNTLQELLKIAKTDARIKIINNNVNLGLACTRNIGLKQATGEYIYFLDSDDILPHEAIETMLQYAKNDIDIVVGYTKAFPNSLDSDLEKKANLMSASLSAFSEECYKVTEKNSIKFFSEVPCIACSKLFKKSFLDTNKLFFIDKKIVHEDNGFFLKVFSCFPKIYFINFVCLNYRIRKNSITSKNNIKNRKYDLKISINDAIKYINETKPNNKKILLLIKKTREYNPYFFKWYNYLYNITYTTKEIRVLLCNIIIYKSRTNKKNKRIYYFCGIPIFFRKIR